MLMMIDRGQERFRIDNTYLLRHRPAATPIRRQMPVATGLPPQICAATQISWSLLASHRRHDITLDDQTNLRRYRAASNAARDSGRVSFDPHPPDAADSGHRTGCHPEAMPAGSARRIVGGVLFFPYDSGF